MTFKINIIHERNERQRENDEKVKRLLSSNLKIQDLKKSGLINSLELDRYLQNYSIENLDENGIGALAMLISVKSSRQGSKDEFVIINGINDSLVNWSLKKPKPEVRLDGVDKSVDAVLKDSYGNTIAYVFCKVVYGSGGHQDNVKNETLQFLKSPIDKNDHILRVCLIDGDIKWKNQTMKYLSDQVWFCDHEQFQNKLVQKYDIELKTMSEEKRITNTLEDFFDAD